MEKNKCHVCNGITTEDGGVNLESGKWVCSSGCWSDYYVGKALKKEISKEVIKSFAKNLKNK